MGANDIDRLPADKKVDIQLLFEMRENRKTKKECAEYFKVNARVIKRLLEGTDLAKSVSPPARSAVCPVCEMSFIPGRLARIYCSRKCDSKAKANPLADDKAISEKYLSGMTQKEIAVAIGVSQKSVYKSLKRASVACRPTIKRNQYGENNLMWKGDSIGYKSAHNRVRSKRGAPDRCTHCGATSSEKSLEWASVNKRHHDPNDYIALCVPCHRKWDAERRKSNGS